MRSSSILLCNTVWKKVEKVPFRIVVRSFWIIFNLVWSSRKIGLHLKIQCLEIQRRSPEDRVSFPKWTFLQFCASCSFALLCFNFVTFWRSASQSSIEISHFPENWDTTMSRRRSPPFLSSSTSVRAYHKVFSAYLAEEYSKKIRSQAPP